MNELLDSTCVGDTNVEKINGRAAYTKLADEELNVGLIEMFQHAIGEAPARLRTLPIPSCDQDIETQIRWTGEFVTVFSHELRNSLGAIRSAADILRLESSVSPTAAKARLLIERQVVQMTRLIEDLLDLSRARSDRMALHCERIDLCAVVTHAAQTAEFTMRQCNHHMSISVPSAPVWLHADPARLEQVLVNLLFNAAKYTDSGGQVGITLEQVEGDAVVRIADTGIGIDPNVLPHVFDLFVQAHPLSRRTDGGLGIGLALVRSLVVRHGGCVTASSLGVGHGSEFTVRLPMPTRELNRRAAPE